MWRTGRTRLYTRRERLCLMAAIVAVVAGVVLAAAVGAAAVSWLSGHGWAWPRLVLHPLFSAREGGGAGVPGSPGLGLRVRFPVSVVWPGPGVWTVVIAVPLWAVWSLITVRPLAVGLRREARHSGLASIREIRRALGARRARAAGRFTLPATTWWARRLLPMESFGLYLGRPVLPRRSRAGLWADWEQRCRVIARTGWGKTKRVLIPLIRSAPGAVLVSSIEPEIFTHTVQARARRRRRLRWRWLTWMCWHWLPVSDCPIAVLDFSSPAVRYSSGYPRVEWNLITGCEDFAVAYRRAVSLVAGVESAAPSDRGSDQDRFFRDSAAEVLGAWLHAAALGDREIDDLDAWLTRPDDPTPRRILRDDPRAEPSAAMNLVKHLDSRAGRTTSGVERYLTLAMNSVLSADGRALSGTRFRDGELVAQFDPVRFIAEGGTVYLLADTNRIERSRPILSLFASEWFFAAEQAALRQAGRIRLPMPCIGFLDELRYGVTVAALPYVASALRKYGVGYVYSVQSSAQEDAVYGSDAQALRDAAGVTIVGGIDISMAEELSQRAGPISVVSATRGTQEPGEHIQMQDALTIRDQQKLADGQAVVFGRGLVPFIAYVPSIHDHKVREWRITREAARVTNRVAVVRAGELSDLRQREAAAVAGARFEPEE